MGAATTNLPILADEETHYLADMASKATDPRFLVAVRAAESLSHLTHADRARAIFLAWPRSARPESRRVASDVSLRGEARF